MSEIFSPALRTGPITSVSGSSSVSNVSLLENISPHTWRTAVKPTAWIWHWGHPPMSLGLPCQGEVHNIDIKQLLGFWGVPSIWLKLMFSCEGWAGDLLKQKAKAHEAWGLTWAFASSLVAFPSLANSTLRVLFAVAQWNGPGALPVLGDGRERNRQMQCHCPSVFPF